MRQAFTGSIVEDAALSDMLLLKPISSEVRVKDAEHCQVSTTQSTDFQPRSQQVAGTRGS
ncbi:MAG: hypothetical protein OEV08_02185 [Nitrospira sp.]|nr:hypothetical protein [Nitrospira sp.]